MLLKELLNSHGPTALIKDFTGMSRAEAPGSKTAHSIPC